MDRFANTSTAFGLTISLTKTILAQTTTSPKLTINIYELQVVEQLMLIYFGSTVTRKMLLETELDR